MTKNKKKAAVSAKAPANKSNAAQSAKTAKAAKKKAGIGNFNY
jgi:hypothetical protein